MGRAGTGAAGILPYGHIGPPRRSPHHRLDNLRRHRRSHRLDVGQIQQQKEKRAGK